MGFYEEFAEKYDKLISLESRAKRESGFFKALFSRHNVKSILDCACGTGHHVIILSKLGFDAKGSDLSAPMIRKAKANSKKYGVRAEFKVSDFRKLTKIFRGKFDAVVCLGNSLPHLSSDKDLLQALREMHSVLRNRGLLILEQRNYDKLLRTRTRFFPVSIRQDEVFFYVLDYLPKKIIFNVVNLNTKSKEFAVYSAAYNPLKKERLAKLLRKAGFGDLEFYQDYDSNRFDTAKSDQLIVICKK